MFLQINETESGTRRLVLIKITIQKEINRWRGLWMINSTVYLMRGFGVKLLGFDCNSFVA